MSQRIATLLLFVVLAHRTHAQGGVQNPLPDSSKAMLISGKTIAVLDSKAMTLNKRIDKQTKKYISWFDKEERRLKRKLNPKDSLLGKQLAGSFGDQYKQLVGRAHGGAPAVYSGRLDSLSTALSFLKGKIPDNSGILEQTIDHYAALNSKLDATERLRKLIEERRDLLKSEFERLGLSKELIKYRKQVYYYRQQLDTYKSTLQDPSKIEAKLLQVISGLQQFKEFFARNSLMSSMFPMPSSGANPVMALGGLQTRASVMQVLANQFGNGPTVIQTMQQNVQTAQGQLSQLRSQVNRYAFGNAGNATDNDIPGFKPQGTKTQTIFSRLEYGFNAQSQKAKWMFPVVTDLGIQAGYKLNDNSTIGIGASYKIGWGKSWNQIEITHQGVGLRSYVDWKLKGSFYISGGYEQNYWSAFKSIEALKNQSAWQSSGLIGLSKKYKLNSKMKGEVKLLWDFLSYQQNPKTQAILFRIGYALK